MPKPMIDEIDRRILSEIQSDGRVTNQDLSERVGLTPSPCLRRLRQMEADQVVTGYVALVDPEKLGLGVSAFVRVRLDQQDDRHLAAFEQAIGGFPEVMECYLMTGDADYQLRVLVEDMKAFEDFLRHKLTKIDGVSQLTTSLALRPVVYRDRLADLRPAPGDDALHGLRSARLTGRVEWRTGWPPRVIVGRYRTLGPFLLREMPGDPGASRARAGSGRGPGGTRYRIAAGGAPDPKGAPSAQPWRGGRFVRKHSRF